ncbi:MAG TPA: Crp/Fnr family transcriptional regulator, partial [Planctomycetaceae bacterium]
MSAQGPPQNRLLAMLPPEDFDRLSRRMERVTLPLKAVVVEPREPIRHAYFPLTNVLSSIIVLADGTTIESATIGNEGMSGVGLLVGELAGPYRVIQQVEGESLRVPVADFRETLSESLALRQLVERYTLTLLQQSSQNAACGLSHSVEERMCRWLLMCADRAGRDEFAITQEFLSQMLGVRRQAVNITAGLLEHAGLIAQRRGHIAVKDRAGLEASACECYRAAKEMY